MKRARTHGKQYKNTSGHVIPAKKIGSHLSQLSLRLQKPLHSRAALGCGFRYDLHSEPVCRLSQNGAREVDAEPVSVELKHGDFEDWKKVGKSFFKVLDAVDENGGRIKFRKTRMWRFKKELGAEFEFKASNSEIDKNQLLRSEIYAPCRFQAPLNDFPDSAIDSSASMLLLSLTIHILVYPVL